MDNKINISVMSGKLNHFLSINTNNLDISFCKAISKTLDKTIDVNKDKLKHFDIIFNVVDKTYLEENKHITYNCNNKCYECLKCYIKGKHKKVIIEKLKDNFKIDSHKKLICNYCYANHNLKTFRKNCINCYQHNNKALSNQILNKNELPIIDYNKYPYVRFNSYGELINKNHLINLLNIVKLNKSVNFSLYTKRIDLIHNYFKANKKPNNLILVYSNPNINDILSF